MAFLWIAVPYSSGPQTYNESQLRASQYPEKKSAPESIAVPSLGVDRDNKTDKCGNARHEFNIYFMQPILIS